ncbi:MAG: TonB-dependent receptor [Bacteroidetes bacterium]|nr:MAG: TonB-dependent receptor [Bacteroidota bacterium]
MKTKLFAFLLPLLFGLSAFGQGEGLLSGIVRDSLGSPVDLANISLLGTQTGTMSDASGQYSLAIPAGRPFTLVVSCVGYQREQFSIRLKDGERQNKDIVLHRDVRTLQEVAVSARQERASTFQRIDIQDLNYLPSTTGKVEAIIKSQAGVSSNNELTAQYSVRGGNFDENLVYVNDIEIYRPFLVRSGQQEGLSFVNSDLVSSVKFSAGGYEARYGDKMSSALDISYKRPTKFAASSALSILGASVHAEGVSRDRRFSYLAGYRYKTTAYLLNSLQTSGDYKPQFSDLQTMLTWQIAPKLELSFLGNYSANKYEFVPTETDVEFGTKDLPLRLKIFYEGCEVDRFETYLGAMSLRYKPTKELTLKFTGSAFRTAEQETFDILGEYWINELDNTIGSETYGDSILNFGVGGLLSHARNYLDAIVVSANHLGSYRQGDNHLQWGLSYQYQDFRDRVSEWELVDSAGYVIPYDGEQILLSKTKYANNEINYDQYSAFVQYIREIHLDAADFYINTGLRATQWNFKPQTLISPRITISSRPNWERDLMFHLSGGVYYQPPFYREMRRPDGSINANIEAQRSIHLLLGGDYLFKMWNRPFKLSGEAYYKWLDGLIPYKIDNVRISYSAANNSKGFARGIDFKLNGEFVPGAESWMTLSLLQAREDVEGDSLTTWNGTAYATGPAGAYPRPSDQLFSLGLFFQDYFPNNPSWKVHLNAYYGSGLPLSSPNEGQYYSKLRMRPYRRVDIGFSRVIKQRLFKSIWISGEIFNLLGIKNEAFYLWIRTVNDQEGIPGQFGVPNYLTGRRFNLRISISI